MTEHNCVRNPETGGCYVCRVPMRQNFGIIQGLDAVIDVTEHPPAEARPPRYRCGCGAIMKPSETQCLDCWIAEQTKQPAPRPTVKQAKPETVTIDSILSAMMADPNSDNWN